MKTFRNTKFKLVTLDHYYNSAKSAMAGYFFHQMVALRQSGYGPDYPDYFLPVDSADYVCWHHLFCVEDNDGMLFPIGGFRQISMSRCEYHRIPMPLLVSAEKAGSKIHLDALSQIFENHKHARREIVYSAGFTIRKEWRKQPEFAEWCKEVFAGFYWLDFLERDVSTFIGAAVLRFKVQGWYPKLGYQPVFHMGERLPDLIKPQAGGDPMMLIQMQAPSAWTKECFDKHRDLYQQRLIIDSNFNKEGHDVWSTLLSPNLNSNV